LPPARRLLEALAADFGGFFNSLVVREPGLLRLFYIPLVPLGRSVFFASDNHSHAVS